MCEDCGCTLAPVKPRSPLRLESSLTLNPQLNETKTLNVIHQILDKNNRQAEQNRAKLDQHGVLSVNMMSSPGSGKTSLLEALAEQPDRDFAFGVIEGDLQTERDAKRILEKGIPAIQIQTGTACHLDAFMVQKGLHDLGLDALELCFVENVGNLVCPASYDLGCHWNWVLLSVPEGDDKVEKYPVMFQKADLVLITKMDLLPHFDFDLSAVKQAVRRLKPNVDVLTLSNKQSETLQPLLDWIAFKRKMRA
jgi:hydrogenase nickel incorporation protein HypB